jgi:hypothetical protein
MSRVPSRSAPAWRGCSIGTSLTAGYTGCKMKARSVWRGLWADATPVAPWEFRRTSRSVRGLNPPSRLVGEKCSEGLVHCVLPDCCPDHHAFRLHPRQVPAGGCLHPKLRVTRELDGLIRRGTAFHVPSNSKRFRDRCAHVQASSIDRYACVIAIERERWISPTSGRLFIKQRQQQRLQCQSFELADHGVPCSVIGWCRGRCRRHVRHDLPTSCHCIAACNFQDHGAAQDGMGQVIHLLALGMPQRRHSRIENASRSNNHLDGICPES